MSEAKLAWPYPGLSPTAVPHGCTVQPHSRVQPRAAGRQTDINQIKSRLLVVPRGQKALRLQGGAPPSPYPWRAPWNAFRDAGHAANLARANAWPYVPGPETPARSGATRPRQGADPCASCSIPVDNGLLGRSCGLLGYGPQAHRVPRLGLRRRWRHAPLGPEDSGPLVDEPPPQQGLGGDDGGLEAHVDLNGPGLPVSARFLGDCEFHCEVGLGPRGPYPCSLACIRYAVIFLVAMAAIMSYAAAELSPSLGGTRHRVQIALLVAVSGSAGSLVRRELAARPSGAAPGDRSVGGDESEKQAVSVPTAASRMAGCSSLVLAR